MQIACGQAPWRKVGVSTVRCCSPPRCLEAAGEIGEGLVCLFCFCVCVTPALTPLVFLSEAVAQSGGWGESRSPTPSSVPMRSKKLMPWDGGSKGSWPRHRKDIGHFALCLFVWV